MDRLINEVEINVQKDITVYPNVAYPVCFILAEPKLEPWYYEHFVNVYSQCWFGDFFRIDYLDSSRFFGDILDRQSYKISEMQDVDIIEFIIDKVDRGFCLNIFTVDEYYVPESPAFQKEHYVHEILVYGYDNSRRKLMVMGYSPRFDFDKFTVDYDNFEEGFRAAVSDPPYFLVDALHTIRLRHFFRPYPFSLERFMKEFHNLIFSVPDTEKHYFSISSEDETTYGIKVYDRMTDTIYNMINGNNAVKVNYTSIHFMCEHKKVLKSRFEYIAKMFNVQGKLAELIKQYAKVEKEFSLIRLTFLKLALEESNYKDRRTIKDTSTLKKIYDMIIPANQKERNLLVDIYEHLKNI